jgi:hypothetical protein
MLAFRPTFFEYHPFRRNSKNFFEINFQQPSFKNLGPGAIFSQNGQNLHKHKAKPPKTQPKPATPTTNRAYLPLSRDPKGPSSEDPKGPNGRSPTKPNQTRPNPPSGDWVWSVFVAGKSRFSFGKIREIQKLLRSQNYF